MATYDLGVAHGRIEIDASSLGRASASLKFLADRMLLLGGAAIAGFGFAVKAAADFETQMSRFKAVSDTSEKDLERVRQKALQLGRDSAFGAKEVAEGFVEIAKSGATATQVLEGLGDAAVFLAAAGEMDMADATRILVNAMHQFGLEAKDSIHIADLLAGAANASTAEVDDLANSLKYAGPVASLAGISIEDTATVLAMFANAGIFGSQAGTTLRGVLLGLAATTPKAEKTLRSLGIVTLDGANQFFNLEGKLKPLPEVFQILNDALKDLDPHQRITALNAIFQRRALTGAALAARDGALGFLAMRKEVEKTTAQEVMQQKLDNLNGSLKKMKASLETLAIVVGEQFQEPLKQTADRLRDLANWFAQLNPQIQKSAGYALFAFGAFLIFGGILFKIGQYTLQSYKAFKGLAEAFRLVTVAATGADIALGPFLLIVLAIIVALAMIAATAIYTYKHWNQIWNWIKDHPAYAIIIALLASILTPLLLIGFVIGALAKNWRQVWDFIKDKSNEVADAVSGAWTSVVNWFQNKFIPFFTVTLANFFTQLPGKMLGWANAAVNAFLGIFNNFPYKVGFALGFVVGSIIRFGTDLVFWLADGAAKAIEIFGQIMGQLIPFAMQLGTDIILQFATWITQLAENLPGWLLDALQKWIDFSQLMVDKGWELGLRMLETAGNWAMEFGPRIMQFIADLPSRLFQVGLDMLIGFVNGLNLGMGGVVEWLTGFPGRVLDAINTLYVKMFNAGVDALKGFLEGLKSMAGSILSWAKNFAGDLLGKITDPLGIFSPSREFMKIGEMSMLGLANGLEKYAHLATDQLDALSGDMIGGKWTKHGTVWKPYKEDHGGGVNHFNDIKIQVVGVQDTGQALAVGQAAAEGFSDALQRRQIKTTARVG